MRKKFIQVVGFLLALFGYGVTFMWTTNEGKTLNIYENFESDRG